MKGGTWVWKDGKKVPAVHIGKGIKILDSKDEKKPTPKKGDN